MNKVIEDLNWRYSTKVFDKTKKVNEDDINEIVEVFRLSPSSYWLQPWKLILVENEEIKKELEKYSWNNKTKIVDCSHLFILTANIKIDNEYIENYLNNVWETIWNTREELKWFEDIIKWNFNSISESEKNLWAHQQVFLALWNVINFLAQKHIDSCIMWWVDLKKYDEILWLEKQGLTSSVILAIWYRDPSDKYIQRPKVRFSKDKIFWVIK